MRLWWPRRWLLRSKLNSVTSISYVLLCISCLYLPVFHNMFRRQQLKLNDTPPTPSLRFYQSEPQTSGCAKRYPLVKTTECSRTRSNSSLQSLAAFCLRGYHLRSPQSEFLSRDGREASLKAEAVWRGAALEERMLPAAVTEASYTGKSIYSIYIHLRKLLQRGQSHALWLYTLGPVTIGASSAEYRKYMYYIPNTSDFSPVGGFGPSRTNKQAGLSL